jgi:anti-sigma B factor antagonist
VSALQSADEVAMKASLPFAAELVETTNGYALIALRGELDIYTAPRFEEVLLESIDAGTRRLIVDLTEVSFIDSTALGVVVGAVKQLRMVDGSLEIICTSPDIRRIFEITGLDRILTFYVTRSEALG